VRALCGYSARLVGSCRCQTTNASSALMIGAHARSTHAHAADSLLVGGLVLIALAFGLRLWHHARLRRARAVRVRHARAALERRTEPVDMTQGWSWVEVDGLARPAQAYMGPVSARLSTSGFLLPAHTLGRRSHH
jgi:hypothetical protein